MKPLQGISHGDILPEKKFSKINRFICSLSVLASKLFVLFDIKFFSVHYLILDGVCSTFGPHTTWITLRNISKLTKTKINKCFLLLVKLSNVNLFEALSLILADCFSRKFRLEIDNVGPKACSIKNVGLKIHFWRKINFSRNFSTENQIKLSRAKPTNSLKKFPFSFKSY